jgi:hypothetical protein
MKRHVAVAGIAGTSALLAALALVSPMASSAATSAGAGLSGTHVSSSTHSATRHLSSSRASAIVLKEVHGGRVTDVRGLRHGGYDAFAVRVTRADGSTVTGFVDRASGVVFDWKQSAALVTSAPAATTSTPGNDDDGIDAEDASDDNGVDAEDASDDDGVDAHDASDDNGVHVSADDSDHGSEIDD